MDTGAEYKATTRLTDREGAVLANIGDTCERVPADSMSWLIEQRLVVPLSEAIDVPAPAPRRRRRRSEDGGD